MSHTDAVPDTVEAVAIALIALVPGYIATSVWSRARINRHAPVSDLRTVLQSLVFTAIIQILLTPLTLELVYPIRSEPLSHPRRLALWAVITLLIAPAVIGQLAARVADALFPPDPMLWSPNTRGWRRLPWALIRHGSPPTIWDTVAAADVFDGHFVVIQFKDGKRVGGAFGQGSAAMTSPEPHGIFLSREWILDQDGDLFAEVPGSRGLMVPTLDEVLWIRIQAPPAEPRAAGTTAAEGTT